MTDEQTLHDAVIEALDIEPDASKTQIVGALIALVDKKLGRSSHNGSGTCGWNWVMHLNQPGQSHLNNPIKNTEEIGVVPPSFEPFRMDTNTRRLLLTQEV